ncbi:MAG: heme o synthase [Myxococcota bacterium]
MLVETAAPSIQVAETARGGLIRALRDAASLTKPRLSSLVVFTAAGGMWLAPGALDAAGALLTLLAIALLVAAANATNCYLERSVDALMTRTENRQLALLRLDPNAVIAAASAGAVIAVALLGFLTNVLTAGLGALAFASYVAAYTPLKRSSSLAVFVGAVPGAIPPLMGWTAITGRLDIAGLVLFAILFIWQVPHFIAIAFYRNDDYARGGFKTLPLVLTEDATKVVMVIFTLVLTPVALSLVPLGVEGPHYALMAIVLGAGFLAVNLMGLAARASVKWARASLHASLLYITFLFIALGIGAR